LPSVNSEVQLVFGVLGDIKQDFGQFTSYGRGLAGRIDRRYGPAQTQ
jgi:hypothetical protein